MTRPRLSRIGRSCHTRVGDAQTRDTDSKLRPDSSSSTPIGPKDGSEPFVRQPPETRPRLSSGSVLRHSHPWHRHLFTGYERHRYSLSSRTSSTDDPSSTRLLMDRHRLTDTTAGLTVPMLLVSTNSTQTPSHSTPLHSTHPRLMITLVGCDRFGKAMVRWNCRFDSSPETRPRLSSGSVCQALTSKA